MNPFQCLNPEMNENTEFLIRNSSVCWLETGYMEFQTEVAVSLRSTLQRYPCVFIPETHTACESLWIHKQANTILASLKCLN